MLKIYTSRKIAERMSKLEIVPDIETRFRLRVTLKNQDTLFDDDVSKSVLQRVEGMTKWVGNGYLNAKFGAVNIHDISTGSKGLLIANKYSNEFIINIDELGYNCINILFEMSKNKDIEVISTRILYHMKSNYAAIINGNYKIGDEITDYMEEIDNEND